MSDRDGWSYAIASFGDVIACLTVAAVSTTVSIVRVQTVEGAICWFAAIGLLILAKRAQARAES